MNTRNQTKNGTDQYPERDKVTDEDRSSTDETTGKPAVPSQRTNDRKRSVATWALNGNQDLGRGRERYDK